MDVEVLVHDVVVIVSEAVVLNTEVGEVITIIDALVDNDSSVSN